MSRPLLLLFAGCFLAGINSVAAAELPRTQLKQTPEILGRKVEELVLTRDVPVGKLLPPGLPTTITYTMTPNRFRPVAEDAEGVFYEAIGSVQKHRAWFAGGVYMSKQYPDMISPYLGEAANLRQPLMVSPPLHPGHALKFRIVWAKPQRPTGTRPKNSG